jgi:16S rRNA processing protein RimM
VDHFRRLKVVRLRGEAGDRDYDVEEVVVRGDSILLKLRGVDSPEEAARLVGSEILVDRDYGAQLGEEEYYVADLEGCRVEYSDGRPFGTVVAVVETAAESLLEVEQEDGRAVMVPFRAAVVTEVDIEAARLTLSEGFEPS